MKLRFDADLRHQRDAIDATLAVFWTNNFR